MIALKSPQQVSNCRQAYQQVLVYSETQLLTLQRAICSISPPLIRKMISHPFSEGSKHRKQIAQAPVFLEVSQAVACLLLPKTASNQNHCSAALLAVEASSQTMVSNLRFSPQIHQRVAVYSTPKTRYLVILKTTYSPRRRMN